MKEENTNVTPEVTEEKVTQPVTEDKAPAPAEAPKEAAPAPVEAEKKEEAPKEVEAAPAPQPVPQPASEPAPAPQPIPQPAEAPKEVPKPVAQPASASIVPEVAPQQAAPTPPKGETIKEAPALNPLANNPQPAQTVQPAAAPQAPAQTTFAPSGPLQTDMDTNIGFVAVGENLKKKKNGPLIATFVIILLVGLAALGYYVIYPYVVKKMTKPEAVYSAVIDEQFKSISNDVSLIAHSRATYNVELAVESNLEALKDLTGYTYVGNFGIDPENKNIQIGAKIKDKDSQEHSLYAYVKGERQYLRLSSYRELVFWPAYNEYKDTWEQLYEVFDDINQEDALYLVDKFRDLLKESIVKTKLTKEDASITIDGKKYKVLNSKYTVDNDTLKSMYTTIINGLKDDDKVVEIIAKNSQIEKENVVKQFEGITIPEEILPEGTTIYINLYTYSVKNTFVGWSVTDGEDTVYYYKMDDYFELKADGTRENEETGKEDVIDFKAEGRKKDGKIYVDVTNGEKELAHFIVESWEENNKTFSYELISEEQKITGEIKLLVDTNDTRSKVDFTGSVNIDKDYVKVSLSILNDWTSEVANINAATAEDLDDASLQAKLQEFLQTLKDTPLAKLFTTTSGEFDPSIFDYRTQIEDPTAEEPIDNCSPGETNCIQEDQVIDADI
ncbi:MAG: hypothetical protein II625_02860 [Bacilli bacterium]|nr:hypothetical protein [Bacilli bacterium]